MSTGKTSSRRQRSSNSRHRVSAKPIPPQPTLNPENHDRQLEPCAATASYFLYAQGSSIMCLHHDTLAIERRFDRHREDVRWISTDTGSERGAGRLAVSYDAGHTTIVWDIGTGDEVARFAAYEEIRIATWMKNGNIAFGNVQGNVILFEPSTSEHISARTIYDPITAIAPAADNRTFAIGYLNGSILIATLQPFTMVHSLNTSNAPSRVTGLAWHASTSRQKSDMLATQTADGSLKVWSIPKIANGEAPNIIRILNRNDCMEAGPCWFAWSKLGRIIQHSGGETRAWDVRTKNVSFETVPTLDNITGIVNHGPTSTLFTLGNNHSVQQYDINPGGKPLQVASAQHAPAITPPSPPNSVEDLKAQAAVPTLDSIPITVSDAETSENEAATASSIHSITSEIDQLTEERRDRVGPLSPVSSRASSVNSSRSSLSGRRIPSYRYDKAPSSRNSNTSANEGTEFSFGQPIRQPTGESISIRSASSLNSAKYKPSALRKEYSRNKQELQTTSARIDLFPFLKARLSDVPFRTPHYGEAACTPEVLRREMLSVVFGWNDDIELLIREELSRHAPGSASSVLLSKWLRELGADALTSMIGSESMTSADWMVLALSTMGNGSQKKIGEAFVLRLLEKGDIHSAVAILLSLGEENDAIEVYVSRNMYMEAILLTCLVSPADWRRQSYLVRRWGEILVAQGQPELAVRCFSCTSIESSETWFSPRAEQRFHTAARKEQVAVQQSAQSPLSPPSAGALARLTAKTASLKLITTFGDKATASAPSSVATPMVGLLTVGVTPIADSAVSPGGPSTWSKVSHRKERDPSSARTATPGGYGRRRQTSRGDSHRVRTGSETPRTAARDFTLNNTTGELNEQRRYGHTSRASSVGSSGASFQHLDPASTAYATHKTSGPDRLPSPSNDVFARLKEETRARSGVHERLPTTLQVQVYESSYSDRANSPAETGQSHRVQNANTTTNGTSGDLGRITQSSAWDGSSQEHYVSEQREASQVRGRVGMRYIGRPKRSPSSPIPMSPEEVAAATRAMAEKESERTASTQVAVRDPVLMRPSSRASHRLPSRNRDTKTQRLPSIDRGRDLDRGQKSVGRSPSSPLPMPVGSGGKAQDLEPDSIGERAKSRQRSLSNRPRARSQQSKATSPVRPDARVRSRTRQASEEAASPMKQISNASMINPLSETESDASTDRSDVRSRAQDSLTRKQLAALELEERRRSLARRPSAPIIPLPGQSWHKRPPIGPRFFTELGDAPQSFSPPLSGAGHERSHTADPHDLSKFVHNAMGSNTSAISIGLPATPRAMRHPLQMGIDLRDRMDVPSMAGTTDNLPQLPSSRYEQLPAETKDHQVVDLLPYTTTSEGTHSPRSVASAPLERFVGDLEMKPHHSTHGPSSLASTDDYSVSRGHVRKASQTDGYISTTQQHSPPIVTASIDETIQDAQIVIVEATSDAVLPELRHLAMPPPPPPPPFRFSTGDRTSTSSLGVINIAIEEESPMVIGTTTTPAIERAATTSPTINMTSRNHAYGPAQHSQHNHRHGRNSAGEGIGSRIRTVTERMRSTSRSRHASPIEISKPVAPYESIMPILNSQTSRRGSLSGTKSPTYKQSASNTPAPQDIAAARETRISAASPLMEQVIPPENIGLPPSRTGSAFQGYGRQASKDIRANMPSDDVQQYAPYQPENMI